MNKLFDLTLACSVMILNTNCAANLSEPEIQDRMWNLSQNEKDLALIKATELNDLNKMEKLIKVAANPDYLQTSTFNRETSLMVAVKNGYLHAVKLLLSAKANVNAADSYGYCPLARAPIGIAQLLLDAGADVDDLSGGFTALMRAISDLNTNKIKLLLNASADINKPNRLNYRAIDIAQSKAKSITGEDSSKIHEIIQLLKNEPERREKAKIHRAETLKAIKNGFPTGVDNIIASYLSPNELEEYGFTQD